MPAPPIRLRLTSPDRYTYLWLKSIRAIDLTQHCATVFHGAYHPDLDAKRDGPQEVVFEPDDGVQAYYLCGVERSRRWDRNAHLAFVPAPGETWEGIATAGDPTGSGGARMHVELDNAAPVFGWGEQSIPPTDPNRHRKSFATCRNYQFAHHLAAIRGLTSQPNPKGRGWMNRTTPTSAPTLFG